jgi:putative Holliday junction resolvase
MARILAIDYGKKRTGLAVTDELQLIAGGLTTVATATLVDFILDYVKREPVERIVVGLPKQMNNTPSENMCRIEPFVNRMRKLLPNIPVEYHDERFTSVLAHQAILASGIGKMARRNKELVDEVSATIILQSYMESRRLQGESEK